MKNIPQATRKLQGFENLNPKLSPFEKAFIGTFNEMTLRENDEDIAEMVFKSPFLMPIIGPFDKYLTLFILAISNGKYDFKPILKKITPAFFHKSEVNKFGKPATVFGTTIPGDNEYIYDHDLWSNIHFGFAAKAADFTQWPVEKLNGLHDIIKGHNPGDAFDPVTNKDLAAIQLGFKIYDECSKNLTKECFERLVFENKDTLNRYPRSDLIEKRPVVHKGDTMFSLALENAIPVEEIIKKNPNLDPFEPLQEGQKVVMPSPDEVKMMASSSLKKEINSSKYLKEKGAEHEASVQKVKVHYDESEQLKKLSQTIAQRLDKPANTETRTPYFIWRCVKDAKVRSVHAQRDGKVYSWQAGPLPGQDYNCRCYAVPYTSKTG